MNRVVLFLLLLAFVSGHIFNVSPQVALTSARRPSPTWMTAKWNDATQAARYAKIRRSIEAQISKGATPEAIMKRDANVYRYNGYVSADGIVNADEPMGATVEVTFNQVRFP